VSTIAVISHQGDAHIPFVKPYLSSKLVVVDPYSILEGKELSYDFDGKVTKTSYRNRTLHGVKSVWYRKPSRQDNEPLGVPRELEEYARSAIENHVQMIRSQFPDAFWLSDFYAINKARNKAWQLHVAASMGFRVPRTIITSDPDKARAFMDKHTPVVIKSQAISFPAINKKTYFFFAKRIAAGEEVNLQNLHLAPAIFQQAIDAAADIRITVVGDQAFAAVITAGTPKDSQTTVRDWRYDHAFGSARFTSYDNDLSPELRTQCIDLVRKMGLVYGAIDLVIDQKGGIWFLEINPNGQWAFIEEETGQPIGKAIAHLLEHPPVFGRRDNIRLRSYS
jgi:glutathione synthase/RimK-type ligase-like ATP-grasp enzyme